MAWVVGNKWVMRISYKMYPPIVMTLSPSSPFNTSPDAKSEIHRDIGTYIGAEPEAIGSCPIGMV